MTSQYENARLLILGEALEYQRSLGDQLSSVETLLQQVKDNRFKNTSSSTKRIISRKKGASREELKMVKHVVQYAIFAAYHLSLETSFLADEGASLPKMSQMTIMPSAPESELPLDSPKFMEDESFPPVDDREIEIGDDLEENVVKIEVIDASDEYYSAADNNNNNQSILVSFSSHCV